MASSRMGFDQKNVLVKCFVGQNQFLARKWIPFPCSRQHRDSGRKKEGSEMTAEPRTMMAASGMWGLLF